MVSTRIEEYGWRCKSYVRHEWELESLITIEERSKRLCSAGTNFIKFASIQDSGCTTIEECYGWIFKDSLANY